jgi:hypothetical protein
LFVSEDLLAAATTTTTTTTSTIARALSWIRATN